MVRFQCGVLLVKDLDVRLRLLQFLLFACDVGACLVEVLPVLLFDVFELVEDILALRRVADFPIFSECADLVLGLLSVGKGFFEVFLQTLALALLYENALLALAACALRLLEVLLKLSNCLERLLACRLLPAFSAFLLIGI